MLKVKLSVTLIIIMLLLCCCCVAVSANIYMWLLEPKVPLKTFCDTVKSVSLMPISASVSY